MQSLRVLTVASKNEHSLTFTERTFRKMILQSNHSYDVFRKNKALFSYFSGNFYLENYENGKN